MTRAATKLERVKPCPFCWRRGGVKSGLGGYWVQCVSRRCDWIVEGPVCDTRKDAIAAWNRATPEQPR